MLPPELIRKVVKHAGDTAVDRTEPHWTAEAGIEYYRKRANVISPLGRIERAWKSVVDDELLKHVALQETKQIESFLHFLQRSKSHLQEDGSTTRAANVRILHTTPRILNSEAFQSLLSVCNDVRSLVVTKYYDDELDPGWDGDIRLRLSAWPGNCLRNLQYLCLSCDLINDGNLPSQVSFPALTRLTIIDPAPGGKNRTWSHFLRPTVFPALTYSELVGSWDYKEVDECVQALLKSLHHTAPQITDLVVFDRRNEWRLPVALDFYRFTSLQHLTMDIIEALALESTEDYPLDQGWIEVSDDCELPIKLPSSLTSLTISDVAINFRSKVKSIQILSNYVQQVCTTGTSLQTITLDDSHVISANPNKRESLAYQELESACAAKGITLNFEEEIYESLPKLAGCTPGDPLWHPFFA